MSVYDLPAVDATLNGISTCFILAGLWFIRRGRKTPHVLCMACALLASVAFLICYVSYHLSKPEPLRFDVARYPAWANLVYKTTLVSHILLAPVAAVLVLTAVVKALRGNFTGHRRVARWTAPVWLYVSVTGVLVYLMLYQWWPPENLLRLRDAG
ncbi:MAG: DUF420 domain-containing protein [Verrucomicrobiales bacterium]|nr:DUF420 domain-containing protein [Verrucomicrobiales bacterium]